MKFIYLVIYPGAALSLFTLAALILRRRLPQPWILSVSILGVSLALIRLVMSWVDPSYHGFDLHIFRAVGLDVWAGLDPYAPSRFFGHPFLHPPSALPFFASLAILPIGVNDAAWKAAISLASIALAPVAARALAGQVAMSDVHAAPSPPLRPGEVGCVGAVLALSDSVMYDLHLGQLGTVAALLLTTAVWAQGRGRGVLAGLCLALATAKIGTMLPFLLLFHRRADLRAWATFLVALATLCLIPGHVSELPLRLVELLRHIGELSGPGYPNELSLRNPYSANILGIEHAAHRIGLHDPRLSGAAQFLVLGLLGLGLALSIWRRLVPRDAACSLVALFSLVFLYHRIYDSAILALPLVYAVAMARSARGRVRLASIVATFAMLSILYMRNNTLGSLTRWSLHHGLAGRFVQATILPHGTWAALLAGACIFWASRHASRQDRPTSLESPA